MTAPAEQLSRPNPDPTHLTTEALLREIAQLKAVVDMRFDGIDKLIEVIQTNLLNRPKEIIAEVAHLQKLHEEKFLSIQKQFEERDTRGEQTSKDSKVAVDAALQAAKEAVGEQNKSSALAIAKSEAATTKQIDLIGSQQTTNTANLNDKIDDLKARLNVSDGRGSGAKDQGADSRALLALGLSAVMAVVGVGSALFAMVRSPGQEPKWSLPAGGAAAVATVPVAAPQIIVVPATTVTKP